jgi:hypothetical protein
VKLSNTSHGLEELALNRIWPDALESVLLTFRVWNADNPELGAAVNVSEIGLTTRSGLPLTNSLTGNDSGLFGEALPEGPLAVTVTVPEQTVPLGIPAGFAETVKDELLAAPVTELTVSQLFVQLAAAVIAAVAAIVLNAFELLLVMVTA